eukprot:scaffold9556_cov64-Phaeocystis_antarctica.AAC.4
MATHNRTPVQLALGRLRLRHPALAASLKKVNKTSQGGVERCYDPEGSEEAPLHARQEVIMQAVTKISSIDYSRSLNSAYPEPTTWSLTAVGSNSAPYPKNAAKPVMVLGSLPDDILLQIIVGCGEGVGLPELDAVSALSCLCSDLLRQLYQLQPLVSVQVRIVTQRFSQGPWRIKLLYTGEPTVAVLQQATRGHVHSIDARRTGALTPAVAKRVVPELLGAGCSLLQLKLEGVKLNGSWAATFGEAAVCSPVLRELQLDDCRLQGPIPTLRLPALQILWMSGNGLTGGLEPLIGCPALIELNCSHNHLTGSMEPLKNCPLLQGIDISHNQITGALIRGCSALKELYCANNQIEGDLEPLGSCLALQKLVLDGNQLRGGLEPLRACTALQKVYIRAGSRAARRMRHNQLTGGLEPLQGCTQLQMLVLDGNQINGGLEPLRGCTALKVLGLGGNQLCGGLEPLKGLTELQKLYISKNQLSGDLKPLACCTGLTVLALSNNNLIGDLEPLRGCAALSKVYGTHNQLEGTLEPFEGRAALHELYLSNNRLQGTLRPLGGCTSLMMLHLYDNQLTGGVEHLMRSTLLQELFLADNHLTVGEEDRAHFERQCELSCI